MLFVVFCFFGVVFLLFCDSGLLYGILVSLLLVVCVWLAQRFFKSLS